MILVVGSCNLDFTVRAPHIPAPGETVLGPDFSTSPGGKGANQAVAAVRAGGQVAFCGAVGRDSYGAELRQNLADNGVDAMFLREAESSTGAAFITVAWGGENAIVVASGANGKLGPGDLPDFAGASSVLLQLEIPPKTVREAVRRGAAAGARVLLNAAPARELDDDLLRNVDVLIVNAGELRTLGGEGEVPEVARKLQARGPNTVVVTLGAEGCFALDGEEEHRLPARPVEVVDTVGAGDTFAGVLAAWLDVGAGLPQALRAAGVAAALACTKEGAQGGMPTRAEIQALL